MLSSSTLRRVLATAGMTLAGTYTGLSVAQRYYRNTLASPTELRPALDWRTHSLETPAGRMHYYHRPGRGTPVVLLHSIQRGASSFEMKPIALHLAEETTRPLYTIDWLGFGRSDRPPLQYAPPIYGQQLYQVLAELVEAPATLIALSLGCEYAAWMGLQAADRVDRLVLISPTGLSAPESMFGLMRLVRFIPPRTGLFELVFARLTQRPSLRDFYEREIFLNPDAVPESLIDYAHTTARVKGAHHALRQFVEGRLSLDDVAEKMYSRLYRPTLIVTPATPGPTLQRFDRLPNVLDRNRRNVSDRALPGGLMPHWEAPGSFFETLDDFLVSQSGRA